MTDNRTTDLLPCPFCGGEARPVKQIEGRYAISRYSVSCNGCGLVAFYEATEAEAIAAWNTRTPIEYDGWFYLPKPKEAIVVYGEPEITRTENGYKVRQIADVVDEAARKWGDELGKSVMKRICEIWNTHAMLANGATVDAIRDAQFARAIQHIVDSCTDYGIVDIEESHIEADDLLCDLLCAHGYVETVDAFKSMRKWYG